MGMGLWRGQGSMGMGIYGDGELWGWGSGGGTSPAGTRLWWGRGSMGTGLQWAQGSNGGTSLVGTRLHGDGVWWGGAPWGHIAVGMGLLWDSDPWVPVSVGDPSPVGSEGPPAHTEPRRALHPDPGTPPTPPPPPFPHGTHLPLSGPEPSSGAGLSCREQSPQERAAPGRTAGRFPMALRERPLPPALGGEWGPPAAPRGTSAAGVGPPGEGTEPPESGRRGARRCCGRWSRCPPRGGHPEGPPGGPPPSSCH